MGYQAIITVSMSEVRRFPSVVLNRPVAVQRVDAARQFGLTFDIPGRPTGN